MFFNINYHNNKYSAKLLALLKEIQFILHNYMSIINILLSEPLCSKSKVLCALLVSFCLSASRVVSLQTCHRLAECWTECQWVSFHSTPPPHQLTDKVRDSFCLSAAAPDSFSFERQTLHNPVLLDTHRHQLILHHHFPLCSLRSYFSGPDLATSVFCFLTSLSPFKY